MKNKNKLMVMLNKAIREKSVLRICVKDSTQPWAFRVNQYAKKKASKLVIEFASYDEFEKWMETDEDKTNYERLIKFLKDEVDTYQRSAAECFKSYQETNDQRWLHACDTNMTRAEQTEHILMHLEYW